MIEPFTHALSASTRYCAVLGYPIRHSASPAMQNAGIASLELDWRYLAFEVRPEALGSVIRGAQEMGFIGLNLTVPHKLLALPFVDLLDPSAELWGAINTIRFEGRNDSGEWLPLSHWESLPTHLRSHGFNTDADAIAQALREDLDCDLVGSRVVLLGAGGAGRVAALKLASEAVGELFLVNRTASRAADLAGEIRARYPHVRVAVGYPDSGEVDLLLNATSLGLKRGDPSPLDERSLPLSRVAAVYDMVYRPAETPLLTRAKEAGCRVANGLGMLLYQGAAALEIWSGEEAPVEEMRAALRAHVYGK